jgi:glycosyltransferase involved in cell wall biosynthesis
MAAPASCTPPSPTRTHLDIGQDPAPHADAMKIGLYLQADGDAFGGSEYWLSCLAHGLSARHDVTLLHHKPTCTLDRLAAFSGHDLSRVTTSEALADRPDAWWPFGISPSVTARSRAFDLFVTITHRIPPACAAPLGALIVLFPLEVRVWPWSDPATRSSLRPRLVARRARYGWLWRRRFGSYRVRTSLSTFAQDWVRRLWAVETEVVYPPNETVFPELPKENVVVSVGRFTTRSVSKAQVELVQMFRDRLARTGAPGAGWTYSCLGQIDDDPADRAYFERAQAEARGHPIQVEGDVARARLKALMARSKIFWHAAGFDIDEARAPHLCEHFGCVTVEAMAAGAVPVVIGRGGQKEIVRHGIDGFLCETLEEMATSTQRLIDDPALWSSMSASARLRAAEFSEERSVQRLVQLIEASSSIRL